MTSLLKGFAFLFGGTILISTGVAGLIGSALCIWQRNPVGALAAFVGSALAFFGLICLIHWVFDFD